MARFFRCGRPWVGPVDANFRKHDVIPDDLWYLTDQHILELATLFGLEMPKGELRLYVRVAR